MLNNKRYGLIVRNVMKYFFRIGMQMLHSSRRLLSVDTYNEKIPKDKEKEKTNKKKK